MMQSQLFGLNMHIGDARQTDMADNNMINIGQLVREHASEKNVVLVGFGTCKGSVIAARKWGEKMERMHVPSAVEGSWDSLLHEQSNGSNSLLVFIDENSKKYKEQLLSEEEIRTKRRNQRAIGVVYNPAYERYGLCINHSYKKIRCISIY